MSELQNSLHTVSIQSKKTDHWNSITYATIILILKRSKQIIHVTSAEYLTPPLFHEVLQNENSNIVRFAQICVPWKWYSGKFLLLFVRNRIAAALPWVWGDFCTKLQPLQCAKLQKIHNLAVLCWFQGVDKQVSHFINGSNNHILTVCKGHVHHASHEPFQQRPLCIAATQDAHVAPRLGCTFQWKIVMLNSIKLISHNITAKMAKSGIIIIIMYSSVCYFSKLEQISACTHTHNG